MSDCQKLYFIYFLVELEWTVNALNFDALLLLLNFTMVQILVFADENELVI